ncbi:MAG TPA: choice-of-anchor Q domain-containing protein, partial [Kiritimatiellia bacterium]
LNSIVHRSGGSTNWDSSVGHDGDENEDKDPLFLSPLDPNSAPSGAGNFRITHGSPAIDAGYNGADLDGPFGPGTNEASSIAGDLDGASRLVGSIDMGAYEFLDSDADRLSDWQEDNIYFSDADDTDSDNDFMDDGDEVYAGTVLTNASSYLAMTAAQSIGTNAVIVWSSASNRSYRLWSSTNLLGGAWNNLGVFTSTPPQNAVTNARPPVNTYYLIGVE